MKTALGFRMGNGGDNKRYRLSNIDLVESGQADLI